MLVPDPKMTDYDLATLRVLNGEAVSGWVGGAAANVCATWLRAHGYASGYFEITQKGRDYLAAVDASIDTSDIPEASADFFAKAQRKD